MTCSIAHSFCSTATTAKPLTEQEAEQLFAIYRKYCPRPNKERDFIRFEFFESVQKSPLEWQRLNVELPLDEIEEIAKKTGILQLRRIDPNCKTLVIGCGSLPLVECSGNPTDTSDPYVMKHEHKKAITINPDLASNPTLVAYFGDQEFPMLYDQQFHLIVIEGTKISDTPKGREELGRITFKDGHVLLETGDAAGREFSWEDNAAEHWHASYVAPFIVPGFESLPQVSESFKF